MEEHTINDAEAVIVAGRDNLSQSGVGSFFFAETAEQDFCEVMSNDTLSGRMKAYRGAELGLRVELLMGTQKTEPGGA